MSAAGKHDDRQLLRPRPREYIGKRHDVVLLTVDDDRIGWHMLDGKAIDRVRGPGDRGPRGAVTAASVTAR